MAACDPDGPPTLMLRREALQAKGWKPAGPGALAALAEASAILAMLQEVEAYPSGLIAQVFPSYVDQIPATGRRLARAIAADPLAVLAHPDGTVILTQSSEMGGGATYLLCRIAVPEAGVSGASEPAEEDGRVWVRDLGFVRIAEQRRKRPGGISQTTALYSLQLEAFAVLNPGRSDVSIIYVSSTLRQAEAHD